MDLNEFRARLLAWSVDNKLLWMELRRQSLLFNDLIKEWNSAVENEDFPYVQLPLFRSAEDGLGATGAEQPRAHR